MWVWHTAKSTTILNYIGKESKKLNVFMITLPLNKTYTPGFTFSKNESIFMSDSPDYTILFAWNYEKEIRNKYYKYKQMEGNGLFFIRE